MAAPEGAEGPEKIETTEAVELRADGRTLSGPAVRYGDLGRGGRERFAPGAFSGDRMADPMRLLAGHSRTDAVLVPLPVELRDDGLHVGPVTLPEGRTAERVDRGELAGLSVGFTALEERQENGIRVIAKAHLDHVGLVARPAYPESKVELRDRDRDDDLRRLL